MAKIGRPKGSLDKEPRKSRALVQQQEIKYHVPSELEAKVDSLIEANQRDDKIVRILATMFIAGIFFAAWLYVWGIIYYLDSNPTPSFTIAIVVILLFGAVGLFQFVFWLIP